MLNGHKGEAKQEKNLCWGAATQVSAICLRSLRPMYIAMSSGAANSKTSQLHCECGPAGLLDLGIPRFLCPTRTMAKWRRLYHESVAAVFARRLY